MNKKIQNIQALLELVNISLPDNKNELIRVMCQGTDKLANKVNTILEDHTLTDTEKQTKIETITFHERTLAHEVKYSLSSKAMSYVTKLEALIKANDLEPLSRDPVRLSGQSKKKDKNRKFRSPSPTNTASLLMLQRVSNVMTEIGHSMALAILYYTSVTIQQIMAKDTERLLDLDVNNINPNAIFNSKTSHLNQSLDENLEGGYSFKLVDFTNKIACHMSEVFEQAFLVQALQMAERPHVKSSEFDHTQRFLGGHFLPGNEDTAYLANIIGIYLEKAGIIKITHKLSKAALNRKQIKKIIPTFYKDAKEHKYNYSLEKKIWTPDDFLHEFPEYTKLLELHRLTEDIGNPLNFRAPHLATIDPEAFKALYLSLDTRLTLPMIIPPQDWQKSNNLKGGFGIAKGGYLSNCNELHAGIHFKSSFSYAYVNDETLESLNWNQKTPYYVDPILIENFEKNFSTYLLDYMNEYFKKEMLQQLFIPTKNGFRIEEREKFIYLNDPKYFLKHTFSKEEFSDYIRNCKTSIYLKEIYERNTSYMRFLNLFLNFITTFIYAKLYAGRELYFAWYADGRIRMYPQGYPLCLLGGPLNKYFLGLHPKTKPLTAENSVPNYLVALQAKENKKYKEILFCLRASLNIPVTSEADASASGISIISLLTGHLPGCLATNIFYQTKLGKPIEPQDYYQQILTRISETSVAHFEPSYEAFIESQKNSLVNSICAVFPEAEPTAILNQIEIGSFEERFHLTEKHKIRASQFHGVPLLTNKESAHLYYTKMLTLLDRSYVKGLSMKAAYNQTNATRVSDLINAFMDKFGLEYPNIFNIKFAARACVQLFWRAFVKISPDIVLLMNLIKRTCKTKYELINKTLDENETQEKPVLNSQYPNLADALKRTTIIISTGPLETHPQSYINYALLEKIRFQYYSPSNHLAKLVYQIPRDYVDVVKLLLATFPNLIHSFDALVLRYLILECKKAGIPSATAHDATINWEEHGLLLRKFYAEGLLKYVLKTDAIEYFLELNNLSLTNPQKKNLFRWKKARAKLLASLENGSLAFSPFILK